MNISILFLILALLCFLADAIGVPAGRVKLLQLGLTFWAASLLISGTFKTP